MNFWQGEKVLLRAIEPSDWKYFTEWNLDSERARHLRFVWPPTSSASVKAWAEEQSQKKLENDAYLWVIENIQGEAVGSISTHDCDLRNGNFRYGVDIGLEHRRKGYASEAIELVLRYYFNEMRYHKVTVVVHGNNTESTGLHEKLGFKLEGVHRDMLFSQGQYYDEIWLGMTAEEYRKR